MRWLVLALGLAGHSVGCAGPVSPDLVITNARVFTNDTTRPWVEAIAIKGDRVVALGTREVIAAPAGASTRAIDAGGRVVVPGFNDARVDLPLELTTPAALSALDRDALMRGVTSLQVVAGGPMRALVDAARQASRQARWRLIRSPEDGERPQDEEPFLPPQPGTRLFANGVAWTRGVLDQKRGAVDDRRLSTIVGWAYGAEDPLVIAGTGDASSWLSALADAGLPEVWQRKRPRFDAFGPVPQRDLASLARFGAVITYVPSNVVTADGPSKASPGAMLDAGIRLALGSVGRSALAEGLAAVTSRADGADGRPLTREEAVRAATWGSAYAERAERDKGWIGPGTLADIAVLSDDIFTVPADRLDGITSVLTLVGGAIVYDAGVLARTGKLDSERSNPMNQVFPPREAGQRNTALARWSHQFSPGRSQAEPR